MSTNGLAVVAIHRDHPGLSVIIRGIGNGYYRCEYLLSKTGKPNSGQYYYLENSPSEVFGLEKATQDLKNFFNTEESN